MSIPGSQRDEGRCRRALALSGTAVIVMTTLHHVYGAFAFDTLWRLHVAYVAVGGVSLMSLLARLRGSVSRWLLIASVVLLGVGWIGAFEGLYNHALRLMVYALASNSALYGSGGYARPGDWLFELTGLLQMAPSLWVAALIISGPGEKQ